MGEVLIDALIDTLSAVFPSPKTDVDEFDGGGDVEILHDVSRGHFIEEAIAEAGERSDPNPHDRFDFVEFAELGEGQGEILEVLVGAFDMLHVVAISLIQTIVAAFGDASVAIDVVAGVFGLHDFGEAFDGLLEFKKGKELLEGEVFFDFERVNLFAVGITVDAAHRRSISVAHAAELFAFVNGIVGFRAHDGAHFDGAFFFVVDAHLHLRGVALPADPVVLLINDIVLVSLFLKIHSSSDARRPAANDADSLIEISHF